jgi:hypothetical protein
MVGPVRLDPREPRRCALIIVWAAEHYRGLTKRLEDEQKYRELAVEELAHRLKNKVATIQSIVVCGVAKTHKHDKPDAPVHPPAQHNHLVGAQHFRLQVGSST